MQQQPSEDAAAAQSPAQQGAEEPDTSADASGAQAVVQFKVSWQKNVYDLELPSAATILDIKTRIQSLTSIPPPLQKLLYKGILKDTMTLEEAKITPNAKIMLMASQAQDILKMAVPAVSTSIATATNTDTRISLLDAPEHQRLIAKGPPGDVEPPGDPSRPRCEIPSRGIVGLLNSRAVKTRLSVIVETGELQIATPDRTQKLPMASVKAVVSEPIKGHDGYHAMGFQLGPTEKSTYWVYWMPSHYVENLKDAVLGPYRSLFGF